MDVVFVDYCEGFWSGVPVAAAKCFERVGGGGLASRVNVRRNSRTDKVDGEGKT